MTESIKNAVATGVATGKKQYEKPEVEVLDLNEQPKLLSASGGTYGAGFQGVDRDDEEW